MPFCVEPIERVLLSKQTHAKAAGSKQKGGQAKTDIPTVCSSHPLPYPSTPPPPTRSSSRKEMIVKSHPNTQDKGKRSRCTEKTRTQRKKSQHENDVKNTVQPLFRTLGRCSMVGGVWATLVPLRNTPPLRSQSWSFGRTREIEKEKSDAMAI